MNTLKSYISESLLDIDNVDSTDALIEEFLKDNYEINGSYTIRNGVVDVKGSITITNRDITQLTNGLFRFGYVEWLFDCFRCKSLKTLEGAPKVVGRDFYCDDCNGLTSLKGAPKIVGGVFYCNACKSLKTLEGAPRKVGKDFDCHGCKSLKSLKGAPEEVGGDFDCRYCGKKFTAEEVKTICKVNKNIYL